MKGKTKTNNSHVNTARKKERKINTTKKEKEKNTVRKKEKNNKPNEKRKEKKWRNSDEPRRTRQQARMAQRVFQKNSEFTRGGVWPDMAS